MGLPACLLASSTLLCWALHTGIQRRGAGMAMHAAQSGDGLIGYLKLMPTALTDTITVPGAHACCSTATACKAECMAGRRAGASMTSRCRAQPCKTAAALLQAHKQSRCISISSSSGVAG